MEKETKALAKELLIERIKAYMYSNPKNGPGAHVIGGWYKSCLKLAEETIETTK